VVLSGQAEGADIIVAEQALDLGIPFESIIACADLIADVPPGTVR
jgi:hypothetical protein